MRRLNSKSDDYDGGARAPVQQRLTVLAALVALAGSCNPAAGREGASALAIQQDVIVITADEATQALDRASFSLRGDLRLTTTEWEIHAETAEINGPLDDPDRIKVDGAPATIIVFGKGDAVELRGSSSHLEFDPQNETLDLNGDAMITRDRQSITSDSIKYLLEREIFSAGTGARVKVITTPESK